MKDKIKAIAALQLHDRSPCKVQEERDYFEKCDNTHNIRKSMIRNIQDNWNDYLEKNDLNLLKIKFSIGGRISFDVFPEGWDNIKY